MQRTNELDAKIIHLIKRYFRKNDLLFPKAWEGKDYTVLISEINQFYEQGKVEDSPQFLTSEFLNNESNSKILNVLYFSVFIAPPMLGNEYKVKNNLLNDFVYNASSQNSRKKQIEDYFIIRLKKFYLHGLRGDETLCFNQKYPGQLVAFINSEIDQSESEQNKKIHQALKEFLSKAGEINDRNAEAICHYLEYLDSLGQQNLNQSAIANNNDLTQRRFRELLRDLNPNSVRIGGGDGSGWGDAFMTGFAFLMGGLFITGFGVMAVSPGLAAFGLAVAAFGAIILAITLIAGVIAFAVYLGEEAYERSAVVKMRKQFIEAGLLIERNGQLEIPDDFFPSVQSVSGVSEALSESPSASSGLSSGPPHGPLFLKSTTAILDSSAAEKIVGELEQRLIADMPSSAPIGKEELDQLRAILAKSEFSSLHERVQAILSKCSPQGRNLNLLS